MKLKYSQIKRVGKKLPWPLFSTFELKQNGKHEYFIKQTNNVLGRITGIFLFVPNVFIGGFNEAKAELKSCLSSDVTNISYISNEQARLLINMVKDK